MELSVLIIYYRAVFEISNFAAKTMNAMGTVIYKHIKNRNEFTLNANKKKQQYSWVTTLLTRMQYKDMSSIFYAT